MTRVLSELLGAREPQFQQTLQQLEILAGHPQADIRLSSSLQQLLHAKLHELGLDAKDTTGRELYAMLGERLKADEVRFAAAIHTDSQAVADQVADVARAIKQHVPSLTSYALKPAVAKRLLKANAPKKTMKTLGYRSADSMLKHETAGALFAALTLLESSAYCKRLAASYSKLRAADFEQRDISIEHPSTARWQAAIDGFAKTSGTDGPSVLSFKELGAVILLPSTAVSPTGKLPSGGKVQPLPTLTTAVLALRAINEIRAAGTFLKLHQMQANFGEVVQKIVVSEPMLSSETLPEAVSWHSLHQYFGRSIKTVKTTMFEPVVAAEELVWTDVEQVIARIAPALDFWKHTAFLAQPAHASGGGPVSCNLTDLLLSHGKGLPFDRRLLQHFRESLRSELLQTYLNYDKLEQAILSSLSGKLAPEMAMI